MPPVSKVRKYKPEEVDRNRLAARAYEIWHKKPFSWQLDASEAILCGQDVVVDVGTFRLSLQFCCDLLKYLGRQGGHCYSCRMQGDIISHGFLERISLLGNSGRSSFHLRS